MTHHEYIESLMRELRAAGLRTASANEPGRYWVSLDGHAHWVTEV